MVKDRLIHENLPEEVIELAKREAAYINHEIEEFQNRSNNAAAEANKSARTLSGQLLLISGAILTFSAATLSSDGIVQGLSYGWKKALVGSWILLAMSAAFGILQIIIDYFFFIKWKNYDHSIALELGTAKYISENVQDAIKKFKKPRQSARYIPTIIQIFLMITGIIIFLIVLSHSFLEKNI